jgi:hypothetical protein
MASFVILNASVSTGTAWTGTAPGAGNPTPSGTISSATDWSDHVRQVTMSEKVAMQDFTTYGDGGFMTQKPGLISADLSIEFNQDFASSNVDAVFGVGFLARTLFYLDIKPTSSARGSTNPSRVYAAYVAEYTPVGNTVGDRAGITIPFSVTGTFARLTS